MVGLYFSMWMDSRDILLEEKKGGVWWRTKKTEGGEKMRRYIEWSRDEMIVR